MISIGAHGNIRDQPETMRLLPLKIMLMHGEEQVLIWEALGIIRHCVLKDSKAAERLM